MLRHRITAVLTAAAAGFCMLSAPLTAVPTGASSVQYPLSVLANDGYPFNTSSSYVYNQLSADEKTLYDNLLASCQQVDNDAAAYTMTPGASYSSSMTAQQIDETLKVFRYDHPEFFWLDMSQTISRGWATFVSISIHSDFQQGAARQSAKSTLISKVQEYQNAASAYQTDYERAKYIFDTMKSRITYGGGRYEYSAYMPLTEGRSYNNGYAKTYSLLCNACGVECLGMGGPGHAWNSVKIAGKWYYVDVLNGLFLLDKAEIAAYDDQASTYNATDNYNQTALYKQHDMDQGYVTNGYYPGMESAYDGSSWPVNQTEQPTDPPTDPPTEPPTEPETTAETTTTETSTETTTTETSTETTTTQTSTETTTTQTSTETTTTQTSTETTTTQTSTETTTTQTSTETTTTQTSTETTTTQTSTETTTTQTSTETTTSESTTETTTTSTTEQTTTESTTTTPAETTTTEPLPTDEPQVSYRVESRSVYFYADDTQRFNPWNLIQNLYKDTRYPDGHTQTEQIWDFNPISFEVGASTPKEFYERYARDSWYHGGIHVQYNGVSLDVGDVWIGQRGDTNLDGKTNASDAAKVLIYAANIGAGHSDYRIHQDPAQEAFASYLSRFHQEQELNASVAARILIRAAEIGAAKN